MRPEDMWLVEEYGAGGIDQSENPRRGSIYDGVNVSSNKGYWTNRPGYQNIRLSGVSLDVPCLMAEYIPNPEFIHSHYYALLVGEVSDSAHDFGEILNSQTVNALTLNSSKRPSGGTQKRWSVIDGLWRDSSETTDPNGYYIPCLILTNGHDRPLIYHQKDGSGQLDLLDSIDGGNSTLSYLTEPPIAEYYVKHKNFIFALKTNADPTLIYYTGLYYDATTPVNVWPTSNYLNVGSGRPITGGASWDNNLVVFKENEVWLVAGDGSPWQIAMTDSNSGAFSQFCVVDTGDMLLYMNRNGIYRWNGTKGIRISHPRLQHLWEKLNWAETDNKRFYATYDSKERRVLFAVSTDSDEINGYIVYNLDTDTFDYWGEWFTDASGVFTTYPLEWLMEAKEWSGSGPTMLGIRSNRLVEVLGDFDTYGGIGGNNQPIYWYMQTQRHFTEDSQSKLLRYMMVRAKKTGDWQLSVLALVDGEGPQDALHRDTAGKHNVIVDSANATTHEVDGTSQFQAASDGPVDVYYMPAMYKLWDSKAITTAGAADEIEFSVAQDSTGKSGQLLVIPEDTCPVVLFDMYESTDPIFDDAGTTFDDERFIDPDFVKLTTDENVEGRSFALWISNVGSYNSGSDWATMGNRMEIDGWGLWVKPRGVLRP